MKAKPDVFAAIGDPTRRQILSLLTAGALTISTLAEHFEVSRPAISKHIKTLHQAGLIAIEEKGRERYCSLDAAGFQEIRDWLAFYEAFWHDKLARLGNLLDKKSQQQKGKS